MSNMEYHYGKLRKVDLKGLTKEQFFEWKCKEAGVLELKDDTWEETHRYYANGYEKIFTTNQNVYEVYDHYETDDDMQKLISHEDGTFTFIMSFYNGGTCLNECVTESLEEYENGH